jgi:ABC-type Fe3+/spermidine/putrescine transport system ATPase subunit
VVSSGADGVRYRYKDSMVLLQAKAAQPPDSSQNLAVNDKIVISLRPEKIILSATRNEHVANSVPARVKAVSFNGSRIDVSVQPDGLPELQTTLSTWQPAVDASVGAELWASWDASASQRIADE